MNMIEYQDENQQFNSRIDEISALVKEEIKNFMRLLLIALPHGRLPRVAKVHGTEA